jgi:hypothetical protein
MLALAACSALSELLGHQSLILRHPCLVMVGAFEKEERPKLRGAGLACSTVATAGPKGRGARSAYQFTSVQPENAVCDESDADHFAGYVQRVGWLEAKGSPLRPCCDLPVVGRFADRAVESFSVVPKNIFVPMDPKSHLKNLILRSALLRARLEG